MNNLSQDVAKYLSKHLVILCVQLNIIDTKSLSGFLTKEEIHCRKLFPALKKTELDSNSDDCCYYSKSI